MARRIVGARLERLRTHLVPRVVARVPGLRTESLLLLPLRLIVGLGSAGLASSSASGCIDGPVSLERTHLLYAFSGPSSRLDSFGSFVRKLGASVDEVDIINASHHDLVDQENWTQLWSRLGDYCGVLLAPPCSTFSRARRYDHGPRPLRGHEGRARYGFKDLTVDQLKEVKTGTLLALRAIAIM
eukprot:4515352-Amphidinium_carterae.1